MDEKITIIEGPPPTFEAIGEGWVLSLDESAAPFNIALTRLRTFNGPELIERCHRAWRHQNNINLEYRNLAGLESHAPILAARTMEVEEGHTLFLWVRLDVEESELEADFGNDPDDSSDDPDNNLDFPNL